MMSVAASALLALCQLWPVTLAFGVPRPAALWRTRVDAGTFAVTIAGKRAGQEIFEIIDVGLGSSLDVRTRSTLLALPGGAVTTKTQLWTDAAFRPRGGIVEITTRGQTSRITLQPQGRFDRDDDHRAGSAQQRLDDAAARRAGSRTSAPT